MPYVINDECIDSLDRSCVDVCPVDCIYEGRRRMYIHPETCIECGACESVCPVSAISYVAEDAGSGDLQDARDFFFMPLPGRDGVLGDPNGAEEFGPIGVDVARVENMA